MLLPKEHESKGDNPKNGFSLNFKNVYKKNYYSIHHCIPFQLTYILRLQNIIKTEKKSVRML